MTRTVNSPEIFVCVPVRDERQLLPQLIKALANQSHAGAITVCLYFDGCTDGSHTWAKTMQSLPNASILLGRGERSRAPNAGHARRAAFAIAQKHCAGAPGIFLSTDADSVPAPDWVSAALHSLQSVDIVAGRIVRQKTAGFESRDRLERYLERLHVLRRKFDPIVYDCGPSHPHTGGANLAMHAHVYRNLGGFHNLACGEDRDLVHRGRLAGYTVRHDGAVTVMTSGRTAGRAHGGLADDLKANFDADSFMVEHPDDALRYYRLQAMARRAYDARHRARHLGELAAHLHCDKSVLNALMLSSPSADAFVIQAVISPPMRTVSLRIAERILDRLLDLQEQRA